MKKERLFFLTQCRPVSKQLVKPSWQELRQKQITNDGKCRKFDEMGYIYGHKKISPHKLFTNYKGENSIYTVKVEQNKDYFLDMPQNFHLLFS